MSQTSIGIGIGERMFFLSPRKSGLIFLGFKCHSVWGFLTTKFYLNFNVPDNKFHSVLRSPQPNSTLFGGPRQLLMKPILPARRGPTTAVVGDPQMEWNLFVSKPKTEWHFYCWGHQNAVKFGCQGHPNGMKFQSWKYGNWIFWDGFEIVIFFFFH